MSQSKKAVLCGGALAIGLAFGATTLPQGAMAEGKPGSGSSRGITQAAPDGSIKIYGQTLNPSAVKTAEGQYKWSDLKHLAPELLPEANKFSKSPALLCEHMTHLTLLYSDEADKSENYIAGLFADLARVYPDNEFFPGEELTLAISRRLSSPYKSGINSLLDLLPKKAEQILLAQDIARKYLVIAFLSDAAHANCPDYAKKVNYSPILAPGEEYDPATEQEAWDKLEEQWKLEGQ